MVYTRITNASMSQNILQNLYTNRSSLLELQEQISSGKKITSPSDDASAAMGILSLNKNINENKTYLNNIDLALSELDTTESTIKSSIEVINRAKELTLTASNGTSGENELSAIKIEIEQLIGTLSDLGNTKFGNKYIFSGLNTENATFSATGDDNNEITYNGTPYSSSTDYQRKVEISDGITVTINLAGDDIFGSYTTETPAGVDGEGNPTPAVMEGSGIFGTLCALRDELDTAISSGEINYDAIREKIDGLDDGLNDLLNAQAKVGGIYSRLEMTQNKYEDDAINLKKYRSGLEDVDLASAISDMQFQQTALEASLQIGSMVMQTSLLNYI
ncbi:MAG: flagellar hook-associated protein FlgL [Candidatus Gastranaerophilales bacterium]|nr:flagellar hook-associated protein FlgL [Candidatus Gastranaerophilales bacterium]